jgi:hypothetical protein
MGLLASSLIGFLFFMGLVDWLFLPQNMVSISVE